MKKVLNRAVSTRIIQRNARIYGQLRDWPWWQLYTKVHDLPSFTFAFNLIPAQGASAFGGNT